MKKTNWETKVFLAALLLAIAGNLILVAFVKSENQKYERTKNPNASIDAASH